MKKLLLSLLAALLITANLAYHYNQSPPKSWSAREPLGWPSGKPTPTLDGAISSLSRAAWDGMITLPVITRVGAYSALAYQNATFKDGLYNPNAGVVAFTETAANLLVNPGLQKILRTPASTIPDKDRKIGEEISKLTLLLASKDGYSQSYGAEIPMTSTPEPLRWKGSIYGEGKGEEPSWGNLTPLTTDNCQTPPSTIDTLAELVNSNTIQSLRAEKYINDPAIVALTIHWVASEGVLRSEQWQGWVRTLQDNLPKNDAVKRDKELTNALILMHSALIKAWHYKWKYQLSSWADSQSDIDLIQGRLLVPELSPSYPDELSAIGAVAAYTLQYANVGNVRIEFPGKLVAAARTRVLPNPLAALSEAQTASLALGLKTEESAMQGKNLGKCVLDSFLSKGNQ
ncbi:MAG: hypothetical protein ACKOW9_06430 [Candidatus Paceibacterota bacterium]